MITKMPDSIVRGYGRVDQGDMCLSLSGHAAWLNMIHAWKWTPEGEELPPSKFAALMRGSQFGDDASGRRFSKNMAAHLTLKKINTFLYHGFDDNVVTRAKGAEIWSLIMKWGFHRFIGDGSTRWFAREYAAPLNGVTIFGTQIYAPAPDPDSDTLNTTKYSSWDKVWETLQNENFQEMYPYHVKLLELQVRRQLIGESLYADDQGLVHWIERFGNEQGAGKYLTSSWSKFLRSMRRKYNFALTNEEIQAFSEVAGVAFKQHKINIEVLGPEAVLDTYREEYFGSCLYSSNAPKLYEDQEEDVVGIVRAVAEDTGELMGRALVWWKAYDITDKEYRVVMDRIYPSNEGPQVDAMLDYAKSQGWWYKKYQSIGAPIAPSPHKMRVKVITNGNFPYMDTFSFSQWDIESYEQEISLYNFSSSAHNCPWDSTGNYNPGEEDDSTVSCNSCGDDVSDNNAFATRDGPVCEYCFNRDYRETLGGEYVHCDDESYIVPDNLSDDALVHVHDTVYNSIMDEHYYDGWVPGRVTMRQVACADRGACEGEVFLVGYLITDIDGNLWYREDENIDEAELEED